MLDQRFTVEAEHFTIVAVYGLLPTDTLNVEYLAGDGASCGYAQDERWIPFCPPRGAASCQLTITDLANPQSFDFPGTYRLRFAGAENPDVEIYISPTLRKTVNV
jgi:hypothetical protein